MSLLYMDSMAAYGVAADIARRWSSVAGTTYTQSAKGRDARRSVQNISQLSIMKRAIASGRGDEAADPIFINFDACFEKGAGVSTSRYWFFAVYGTGNTANNTNRTVSNIAVNDHPGHIYFSMAPNSPAIEVYATTNPNALNSGQTLVTTIPITYGVTHNFQIKIITDGAVRASSSTYYAALEIWKDGNLVYTYPPSTHLGVTTSYSSLGAYDIGGVVFSHWSVEAQGDKTHVSNVVIWDSVAGTGPDTFPLSINTVVECLLSTESNTDDLAPNGDTDYAISPQTFDVQNLVSGTTAVLCARGHAVNRADGTTNRSLKVTLTTPETTAEGIGASQTGSYSLLSTDVIDAPSISDINAATLTVETTD